MTKKNYSYSLVILICSILLVISCKKNAVFITDISESNTPIVSTVVKDIYQTTAIAYGKISNIGGSEILQCGVCYDIQANPTINTNKIVCDTLSIDFFVNLTKLSASTTYYVRAFATNSDGTGYGESVEFTTKAKAVPEINTNKTIEITQNTAKSGGVIISDGGDPITISGVCWNTISEPTISNVKSTDGPGNGSFSSIVNGLKANTTYYVRAYATNIIGTGYGVQDTFKTSAIPTSPVLSTTNMSSITQTTAKGGGTIISNGGSEITECGICYGINKAPAIAGDKAISSLSGNVFSCNLSNLNPGITYYVRAYAINSVGTSYGEEIQFITGINIPALTTTNVSLIGYNTATSGGTILSNGGNAISSYGICYSTAKGQAQSGLKVTGTLNGNSFSCKMEGLYANTSYYICAYATNNAGTGYGAEVSFTTSAAPIKATVKTSTILSITDKSAIMGGEVTSTGGADVTERGICYATTQSPTTSNFKKIIGSGLGSFSENITGLTDGTKYYVRAYAINYAGSAYGDEVSFTTPTLPILATSPILNITQVSATFGGNITSDGGSPILERGFCFNTTGNPTSGNNPKTDGVKATGLYSINVTGLSPNVTYHVKAYAKNNIGINYGDEITFTTKPLAAPTIEATKLLHIVGDSATVEGNITSDNGDPVIERGFCYSYSPNPTIADNPTPCGPGTGIYTHTFTNLVPATLYYIRAYAKNNVGISYGDEIMVIPDWFRLLGSDYQGGQIAYIFQDGDQGYYIPGEMHGIIVSALSDGIEWISEPFTGITTSVDFGKGNANTNLIVSLFGANAYAAKLCFDLDRGGYSDWYLPSLNELRTLNEYRSMYTDYSGVYWSSTVLGNTSTNIKCFDFSQGEIVSADYSKTYKVLAIRTF